MLQLIKRNLYFRRWTLILYFMILLLWPFHYLANQDDVIGLSFVYLLINVIAVIDSAHAYRLFRRLGHNQAYLFHHSLPVSKMQLLNAHYVTVMMLTAFGALLIWSYGIRESMIDFNGITFSTMWLFISANLLTFIVGFPSCSEKMNDKIPIIGYIFLMLFLIPFVICIILVTIGMVKFDNPLYFAPLDVGIWYFILAIILALISYLYQIFSIIKR